MPNSNEPKKAASSSCGSSALSPAQKARMERLHQDGMTALARAAKREPPTDAVVPKVRQEAEERAAREFAARQNPPLIALGLLAACGKQAYLPWP